MEIIKTGQSCDRQITLQIINNDLWQEPCIEGNITLSSERKNSPATLKFSVIKDGKLNFQEGNAVKLIIDGKNVFFGFIFTKERDKENIINVTAYDQLRYFKNKDYMIYKGKTAGSLLKAICSKFNLKWGNVADTKYQIPQRVEDDKTMFDIMQYAIEETCRMTKELYVLYDDFGKLALKNVSDMKLDLLIDDEAAENFSYKTSIDGETYNQVKLTYENDKTKKREVYIAKDSDKINQWGVLQYTGKIDENVNGKAKADALLKLYNTKTRNLSIKDCFGDLRVRAGCLIAIKLELGDINVFNYMLIEKATHTFTNGHHSMDLTLSGTTTKGVNFSG